MQQQTAVTEGLPANTLAALLRRALTRFPEVAATLEVSDQLIHPGSAGWSPDELVSLVGPAGPCMVALKRYPALYPGRAQAQRLLAQDWQREQHGRPLVVFNAPFISSQTRELLFQHGIGCIDDAGNVLATLGGLVLDREVPGNPSRVQREMRSMFTPQAFRVVRTLLLQPRIWSGSALATAAGVSSGHVSQLKQRLTDEGWIRSTRTTIELTHHEALLQAWRASRGPMVQAASAYTVHHGEGLSKRVQDLFAIEPAIPVLLAGASCARHLAPFVRGHDLHLMLHRDALPRVLAVLDAETVSRGGNILLATTDDSNVLSDALPLAGGMRGTDLLTTYWMLAHRGERFAEAADHLASTHIRPLWQPATGTPEGN